jgi:hypothetical protein
VTDKPYMMGNMQVGTPEVTLDAMFLMNFENVVAVSKECTNCPPPIFYDPSISKTKKELNETWNDEIIIPYTNSKNIDLVGRGISDKVCLISPDTVCT